MHWLKLVVFGGLYPLIHWCSGFVEICRSQDVIPASILILVFICSVFVAALKFVRKRFYACEFVQEVFDMWILIPCWWSIHSPTMYIKYSWWVIVCYDILRLFHYVWFFTLYFHLGCSWGKFNAPYLYILLFLFITLVTIIRKNQHLDSSI